MSRVPGDNVRLEVVLPFGNVVTMGTTETGVLGAASVLLVVPQGAGVAENPVAAVARIT